MMAKYKTKDFNRMPLQFTSFLFPSYILSSSDLLVHTTHTCIHVNSEHVPVVVPRTLNYCNSFELNTVLCFVAAAKDTMEHTISISIFDVI